MLHEAGGGGMLHADGGGGMLHDGGSSGVYRSDTGPNGGGAWAAGSAQAGTGERRLFAPADALPAHRAGLVATASVSWSIADSSQSGPQTFMPGEPPAQPDLSKSGPGDASGREDPSAVSTRELPAQDNPSTSKGADPPTEHSRLTAKTDSASTHALSTPERADPLGGDHRFV
jgi:hypothetical protein